MENLGIFFTSLKRKKHGQYLIQFQFVLLQIVSTSVLDQVSGIFFFFRESFQIQLVMLQSLQSHLQFWVLDGSLEGARLHRNTRVHKGVAVGHALGLGRCCEPSRVFFVTVSGCSLCLLNRLIPSQCAVPCALFFCLQRPLSGGQVHDEISSESKFSRPSLVDSLELKPSKDVSSVSVSSRAYLAL